MPVQPLDAQEDDDGAIDRELNEEAAWIFAKALSAKTVSSQEQLAEGAGGSYDIFPSSKAKRKSEDAVPKIREVLHLIRKDMFEVLSTATLMYNSNQFCAVYFRYTCARFAVPLILYLILTAQFTPFFAINRLGRSPSPWACCHF